ncbi:GrpB family protein [Hymenobacter cellulosivorans]|uniref:GrpB family protein n=1 Tax=Hymenobacter cellulosivorans TaxID=2932249 RepID=A0ABY4F5S5_9BACT|nr:GrpB family protein [Hymenobacter cellulosivorans]UOQ52028.1 GrpB family protein [Hymenobacter cellulosivorans]
MQPIEIVDYNPAWPSWFEELKNVYATEVGPWVRAIEHVGSTSVPGLAAKPILDIDLIIESPGRLALLVEKLAGLGYQHAGDQGIPEREAFKRLDETVPYISPRRSWPAHHLYVCIAGSASLTNHLTLRNYLRTHPAQAQAYAALKRKLARQHPYAIESYVEGKTAFILDIIGRSSAQPAAK